ncbi:MAG: hypothetical protein ABJB12_21855 [Pseudomonadota bacterium]
MLVAFIGFAERAQAEPGLNQQPPVITESHWYGWQTLLTDGGAVALPVVTSTFRNEPATTVALVAGASVLALGAPIVHLAHGRRGASALSLGLRLTLSALAAVVFSKPCRGECSEQSLLLLLLPAPVIIDATALAWEKRRVLPKVSWTVSPLRLPDGKMGLGVSGRF